MNIVRRTCNLIKKTTGQESVGIKRCNPQPTEGELMPSRKIGLQGEPHQLYAQLNEFVLIFDRKREKWNYR